MIRLFIFLLFAMTSGASYASCYGSSMMYGSVITVDLSDKLSAQTPEWTGSFTTQYAGSFSCSTRNSEFGYTPILSTDNNYATIFGFENNKHKIRAEITSTPANVTLADSGSHQASELNVPFQVKFTLVNTNGTAVSGNTAYLSDVLFVTDLSGMSLLDIILWPAKQLIKILQWLLNGFNWPYDQRDMLGQPMTIKYAPKSTTCSFGNAGLTVTLPTVGVNQIAANRQAGLTPFTLNMRCDNISSTGTSDRAIDMYLSSTRLLSSDSSVLIDTDSAAAKGVGLRLVKLSAPEAPVLMTTSTTARGNATSLFSVAAGGSLSQTFSIPMAAYYYPHNAAILSAGKINTSATLNIIYP